MSKELEITKEYGKDSWGLKGLTLEELRALYEAVRTTDPRNLHDVKEILEETFSNLNNKDNGKRNI